MEKTVLNSVFAAGEMAQLFRVLVTLPENLGLLPSTHLVANDSLNPVPKGLKWPACTWYTNIYAENMLRHIEMNK